MMNIIRALRLPFITASILPFIFGSTIALQDFNLFRFLLGLIAVIATHLSANLMNDYADSRSGADWQDKKFYGFFGGSKLIQEGLLSEQFYLKASLSFGLVAFASVIILALVLKTLWVIALYLMIILLSWQYSAGPLRFSYRYLGELFIFLLFGPALVMGGYFIQSGVFPEMKSFILSMPLGLLTTAILFANELPDLHEDKKAHKLTWVSIAGPRRAFLLYCLLILLAFLTIVSGISLKYLSPYAYFSLIFIFPAIKAASILRRYPQDKLKLTGSSRLTIAVQALVALSLIISNILCLKS